jgi:hypothetical protein
MRITSWIHNAAIYCDDCKPDSRCSDDRCGDSECCPQPIFSTNDEADRNYAEMAFDVLVNPITNEKVNNKRAQAKVLETVRRMIRKQVLNVF